MDQSIRNVMTSEPRTIDVGESVAYATKMMQDEDVGFAPIVEDDKTIGIRVVAQGRNLDQSRSIRSRISSRSCESWPSIKCAGIVAHADVAREGDDMQTGALVEESPNRRADV
jgi:CBS domain-containing protein